MSEITLSVVTSCRNRADYLERVWRSLIEQSRTDFEWIVGDDGSSDGSDTVVRHLAEQSPFPVTLVRSHVHVGKSRIDNAMIAAARGPLVLFCDSDDVLTPDAVDIVLRTKRAKHIGIIGLAAMGEDVIFDPFLPAEEEISWVALRDRWQGRPSDLAYAAVTEVLRQQPFLEVDLLCPESANWLGMGDRPNAIVHRVLLKKEYRAKGAISYVPKMAYNRGRAHAAAIERRIVGKAPLAQTINFQRWAIHGDIGAREARSLWGVSDKRYWWLWPAAAALAIKDRLQGKVDKTHLVFEANRAAPIMVENFERARDVEVGRNHA